MTLDATAKAINVKKSIKKFFDDQLETIRSVEVMYDRGLADPDTIDRTTVEWVSINIGTMDRVALSSVNLDIHCCTRSDIDGEQNSILSDDVFDTITDNTFEDGTRRITLYDCSADLNDASKWVSIGAFIVDKIIDGPEGELSDNTKYKTITCRLRWVAKT